MENMSELSKRVEGLLAEKEPKWGRTKLAEKIGVSYQGVKKFMDGGGVNAETLFKIAEVLNVSPYWLFTGNSERGTWMQAVGGKMASAAPTEPLNSPMSQKAIALAMMYDTAPLNEADKALLFRRASAALLGFEHLSDSPKTASPGAAESLKKSSL